MTATKREVWIASWQDLKGREGLRRNEEFSKQGTYYLTWKTSSTRGVGEKTALSAEHIWTIYFPKTQKSYSKVRN